MSNITSFINKLSAEKTFITFQGEELSVKEEQKYIKSNIKRIKSNKLVHLVAVVNNQIIGSSDVNLKDKICSHIGSFGIVISKDYRGLGFGNTLMNLVINEAIKNLSGLKIITLEVFGNNPIAQSLYKKMGFVEFGRLKKGIKHKNKFVDQVLMSLSIR